MENLNLEALKAIEDVSDEELLRVTGADGSPAASGGVVCTISHECHYNSASPGEWATCC